VRLLVTGSIGGMPSYSSPDGEVVVHIDGTENFIHRPYRCAGINCVIHNPSIHKMNNWPMYVASDGRGPLTLRGCPHNYFHPDPDSAEYMVNAFGSDNEKIRKHPCDGCCKETELKDFVVLLGIPPTNRTIRKRGSSLIRMASVRASLWRGNRAGRASLKLSTSSWDRVLCVSVAELREGPTGRRLALEDDLSV